MLDESESWVDGLLDGADNDTVQVLAAAAAVRHGMNGGAPRRILVASVTSGDRAAPGDRRWFWAMVTLAQHGDGYGQAAAERFATVPAWAATDPLLFHLANGDRIMAGQDTLRDSVERELTSIVNEPDGDPTLRRLAAFELSRYATGTWRLLSLAVLSKTG